jgi:lysophospholipase L1-like esterase
MIARSFLSISVLLSLLVCCLSSIPARADEKSSAQQAWEAQLSEEQRQSPAYAWVEDEPGLPRVLLIGDSISIGYTPAVRETLKGVANVHRIPTNGGDTNRGLASIDAWLGDAAWDVIHFNWGLHDIKRLKDGQLDASMDRALTPEAYEANLRKLVERLKKTGARLVWCATTPVPQGAAGRIPGDEVLYNGVAARIMAENEVPVNDLYARVNPVLGQYQLPQNVHFTDEGSAFLGGEVAGVISSILKDR